MASGEEEIKQTGCSPTLLQREAPVQKAEAAPEREDIMMTPLPRRNAQRYEELARRRQKTFLEKRRDQKRLRLLYGRFRFLIKLVTAAFIAYGLWAFLQDPILTYDSPRVSLNSNRLLSTFNLTSAVSPYRNRPIYEIDPEMLEADLKERFDIIDEVYVRRFLFPARIEISVTEKQPWGEVFESPTAKAPYALMTEDLKDKYQLIDLAEYHYDRVRFALHPLAKVIVPRSVTLKPHFMGKLDKLLFQLNSVRGLTFQYLDSSNPDQLVAVFVETQVLIGRLEPETTQRLERLLLLIPKIHEMKDKISSVDLRWMKQVTFHKRPGSNGTTEVYSTPVVPEPEAPTTVTPTVPKASVATTMPPGAAVGSPDSQANPAVETPTKPPTAVSQETAKPESRQKVHTPQ